MKWYSDFKEVHSCCVSSQQKPQTVRKHNSVDILYNTCCVDRLPVSFIEIIKSQYDEKM